LHAEEGERDDWSRTGTCEAWDVEDALDLLQNKIGESVREMRQEEERRLEGERGAGGHRRRRIRSETPAGRRHFDEEFFDG
jgi:hypothetical protein